MEGRFQENHVGPFIRRCLGLFHALLVFLLCAALVLVRVPGMLPRRSLPRGELGPDAAMVLRSGDLILQRGAGLSSDLIVAALAESVPFSHIGVVTERDGGLVVVHTINGSLGDHDGVQVHRLDDFVRLSRAGSAAAFRPLWPDDQVRTRFVALVEAALSQRLPFDNGYSWLTDDAQYCGELVAKALEGAGFWNAREACLWKGPVVLFASFHQPEYFGGLDLGFQP